MRSNPLTNGSPSRGSPAHPTEGPPPPTSRRLQRMGAVTVGISLPREWVGEHGLKPGGSVFLRALDDGSILVRDHRTAHPPTPLTIVVPLRAPPEHLFRQLIATYLEGAQEIVVREPNGLTEETLAIIKTFVRRTIQPEIVSQETDRITLREVSRGAGLPTRSLLRRVFALVLDIHKTANRSLGGERPLEPDLWIDSPLATRDDDIDRYAWLIERIVRLQLNPGSSVETSPPRDPDVLSTLLAARCLERVADHAVGIAEHGARLAQANLPETTVRPLAALHIQILDLLPQAFGVIDEPNATRANEVIDASEAQHVACDTLF